VRAEGALGSQSALCLGGGERGGRPAWSARIVALPMMHLPAMHNSSAMVA
jgi:hypothetical protein